MKSTKKRVSDVTNEGEGLSLEQADPFSSVCRALLTIIFSILNSIHFVNP
jgi:hypothetical protein